MPARLWRVLAGVWYFYFSFSVGLGKKGDTMVVDKILNNNIVSSFDENGREILLAGRGIGWQAKPGQAVDRSKIEKIFRMDSPDSTSRLKQLLLEVDLEAVRAATKIIEYARETLKKKLNKNLYITLTDHISFAAERMKNGLTFHNMLSLETRKLYPQEYAIGIHSLQIIQELMGVSLPEAEATSIALHIINAEYDCDMEKTQGTLKIVQNSLNIVRYRLCVSFDEESLDYQRFLTHLLFFAQRVMENKMLPDEEDFLYQNIKRQQPQAFDCTLRIRDFIKKDYQIDLPAEELTYLCVHIARVAGERKRP